MEYLKRIIQKFKNAQKFSLQITLEATGDEELDEHAVQDKKGPTINLIDDGEPPKKLKRLEKNNKRMGNKVVELEKEKRLLAVEASTAKRTHLARGII